MKTGTTIRIGKSEKGIALLISIFILLLISVVAIALIVSSGTESALAGNYRSSTGVYYAALSGLEEARGRLLAKNPNSFKSTASGFLPSTLPIGSVAYVLNPGPTEAMGNILTTYPDTEYDNEFNPGALAAATVTTTASVWNRSPLNSLNLPGPLYKWVRINAVSEQSLKLLVAPYAPGPLDSTSPVFYDSTIGTGQLNITPTGSQVLEITSFAVLPNGSQKLLQYLVAPIPINLPDFNAALIIAGNSPPGVVYTPPTSNSFYFASGIDLTTVPFCTAGASVHAIGVFDTTDVTNVTNGILPISMQTKYTGAASAPDVVNLISSGLFPTNLQKPSQLDGLAQTIIANADAIAPPGGGNATGSDLTAATPGMSSSNPLTVVVKGNLDLHNWYNTGYGLLLVTGKLSYDPAASWQGIILVIGQGTIDGEHPGSGEIDGAVLVAKTRDSGNILLPDPNLGKASVKFEDDMGGNGIRYSSCWIQASIPLAGFRILSFHEISQ